MKSYVATIAVLGQDYHYINYELNSSVGFLGLEELGLTSSSYILKNEKSNIRIDLHNEKKLKDEIFEQQENLFKKDALYYIKFFFDSELNRKNFLEAFQSKIMSSKLENVDSETYLKAFRELNKGVKVSDWWVGPKGVGQEGDRCLYIDPALAFGTGDHPTTHLCLKALLSLKKNGFVPKSLLDFGCGSGVLTLFARKLWPDLECMLFDVDPICESEVRKNIALNNEDIEGLNFYFGERYSLKDIFSTNESFDLIVSNIYFAILENEVELIAKKSKKASRWILSGINDEDNIPALRSKIESTGAILESHETQIDQYDLKWSAMTYIF